MSWREICHKSTLYGEQKTHTFPLCIFSVQKDQFLCKTAHIIAPGYNKIHLLKNDLLDAQECWHMGFQGWQ